MGKNTTYLPRHEFYTLTPIKDVILRTTNPINQFKAMNIPLELLSEMLHDTFYKQCCITGKTPIQFHHNFIFGYGKVNEKWCVLPLHKDVHDIEKRKDVKEKLDWIMLNRANDETLKKYSKVENLIHKRARLNEKFGGAFKEKIYD